MWSRSFSDSCSYDVISNEFQSSVSCIGSVCWTPPLRPRGNVTGWSGRPQKELLVPRNRWQKETESPSPERVFRTRTHAEWISCYRRLDVVCGCACMRTALQVYMYYDVHMHVLQLDVKQNKKVIIMAAQLPGRASTLPHPVPQMTSAWTSWRKKERKKCPPQWEHVSARTETALRGRVSKRDRHVLERHLKNDYPDLVKQARPACTTSEQKTLATSYSLVSNMQRVPLPRQDSPMLYELPK